MKGDVMDQAISTIVPLFRATDKLFHDALAGIEREDLLRRPHDNSNPMIWVAGHAMTSRASLTRMAGERIENPWSDIFARGATLNDGLNYPAVSELILLWDTATEKLMSRLNELTDEELSQPSP